MKIVNLTSHLVTILDQNNNTVETIHPCGEVARVEYEAKVVDYLGAIPVSTTNYKVSGLPKRRKNTIYIVSRKVFEACIAMNREDCYYPNQVVRDRAGNKIGCRSLGYK